MTARPRETGRARRADVLMFALGAMLLAVAFVWMVALLRQAPLPETVPDDPTPAIAPPPSAQVQRLHDEAFGVALDGLAMRRVVQMLQWRETDSPLEPGSEVVSEAEGYQQVWSERIIDSSRFRHPEGHATPPARSSGVWGTPHVAAARRKPAAAAHSQGLPRPTSSGTHRHPFAH